MAGEPPGFARLWLEVLVPSAPGQSRQLVARIFVGPHPARPLLVSSACAIEHNTIRGRLSVDEMNFIGFKRFT